MLGYTINVLLCRELVQITHFLLSVGFFVVKMETIPDNFRCCSRPEVVMKAKVRTDVTFAVLRRRYFSLVRTKRSCVGGENMFLVSLYQVYEKKNLERKETLLYFSF